MDVELARETKAKARSQTIQAPAKYQALRRFGFSLLWLFCFAALKLWIVSCSASRHGAVGTGIPEGQAQEEFLHLGRRLMAEFDAKPDKSNQLDTKL